MEIALRGIGVSPGIAIGPALLYGVQSLDVPKYTVADKAAERQRFEAAAEEVREDLQRLYDQTAEELGESHADIFKAHLMILDDVDFRKEIADRLEAEGLNVEHLVDEYIARHSRVMQTIDDPRFQEKMKDLLDVGARILGRLLNVQVESLGHLERPSVIVAHDLSPSDTVNLDLANTLGVCTDLSGPTSHTAILARALEIPAVVGLRYVGQHTAPGDIVILDGGSGQVIIRPSESTLGHYVKEKRRLEDERKALLQAERNLRNVTLDGYEIPILANIELPQEVSHCLRNQAEGVGLFRTEYLYLNRSSLPTEDEQYEAYAHVAATFKPRPVTLRTLDLGGDKFASHLRMAPEINPQLGWRAIRFCLERPDIFKAQLRAIFRAGVHGNVRIMFPLISGLDEFRRVKEVVKDVCADLERRSVPFGKNMKIGSMIEVPSAVAIADLLAKECDFFSIGTNDLIQYSLAVDRVNEKIAHMYEPAHSAIIRMIHQTIRAAKAARIPCAICGEMAGDPIFTELLVGLGIDELSMSAVAIPLVRAEISELRMSGAKRFARRVLGMSSGVEIRAQLVKRYKARRSVHALLDAPLSEARL